jgi:ribose/xylose/arabinose/galactoside ABC-type transport system permease subunit
VKTSPPPALPPVKLEKKRRTATASPYVSAFLRRNVAYVALVCLVLIFGVLAPQQFLTLTNLGVILQNSAVLSVVAIGITFVIIAGSIDLSVGSVMALSGAVAAMFSGSLSGYAFFIAPLVGALLGAINGGLFVMGRIPSFVVTLGMLSMARGVTVILTGGAPIPVPFESSFYEFGTPPIPFVVVIIVAVVAAFFLMATTFGRYCFAIGGDEEKTRILGVPVNRIKFTVFVLSGALAGVGGGIVTAQLGSGSPTVGIGFELMAISAVVIGGTPLTGGMGSILGTVVGSLVITTLANGLIILGISTNVQTILTGAVLVIAVLISIRRDKIRVMK